MPPAQGKYTVNRFGGQRVKWLKLRREKVGLNFYGNELSTHKEQVTGKNIQLIHMHSLHPRRNFAVKNRN